MTTIFLTVKAILLNNNSFYRKNSDLLCNVKGKTIFWLVKFNYMGLTECDTATFDYIGIKSTKSYFYFYVIRVTVVNSIGLYS